MEIKEIKKQLPVGAIKKIAEMSGVHYASVQAFLSGKKTRSDIKIVQATTEFLTEYKQKKTDAFQKLQAVANL